MTIAVLGLGLMGSSIALRLQELELDVIGWNRGRKRRRQMAEQGLKVCDQLQDALAAAETLLLTLSDARAIDQLLFQDSDQNLAGRTLIQMGTIAPEESRRLEQQIRQAGGDYLEAPVLGSIPEAKTGDLIIMAGGDPEIFGRCRSLLAKLGREPRLIGSTGQGAALKLAMNQLIASLTIGFSSSLALVQKEGLNPDLFMALLRKSALYAPTFDKKLGKMLSHDYGNPNFPLKHLLKDVTLFSRVAGELGIDISMQETARRLLEVGVSSGMAELDYSSLYESVAKAQAPGNGYQD